MGRGISHFSTTTGIVTQISAHKLRLKSFWLGLLYKNLKSEKPALAIENSGDGERVDTLLPSQFQIVRSERVAGLNVRPSKYSTQLASDQENGFCR